MILLNNLTCREREREREREGKVTRRMALDYVRFVVIRVL